MTKVLIAEDEPLLAAELSEALGNLWPDVDIVAMVSDGQSALDALANLRPEVMFLDVQMPGLNGLDVARMAGTHAHIVFVTAFDHYAVEAFDEGAVDYLLKPFDPERLARAVQRVKSKLQEPAADLGALLARLVQHSASDHLRFVTVLKGREIHFIPIDDVCYFQADSRYVAVVTAEQESLISTPLKELLKRVDADVFWQIHRGTVVNANAIESVRRTLRGNFEVRLKHRTERLAVSAPYAYRFRAP